MNKREQRTQAKIERIRRAALALFSAHGPDKVSMDEIAAAADVSKVTIYRYFDSKETLYAAVIDLFVDDTLAAADAVLNSELPYLDKLKRVLLLQFASSPLVSFDHLYQIWEHNPAIAGDVSHSVQGKVKALMVKFFDEGKREGYIDKSISMDSLHLYAEVFRAGIRATLPDVESARANQRALEELYDLYFFGFIKRTTDDTPEHR